MIEFKIVMETNYRFDDMDKEVIKNFLLKHFKNGKEVKNLYFEEGVKTELFTIET